MTYQYGDEEIRHLESRDPLLGLAIKRIGRVEREVIPDIFAALVNSIVGQQISSGAAQKVWQRLCAMAGEVSPKTMGALSTDQLRQVGIPMRKAIWIQAAANKALCGEMDIQKLSGMEDEAVIRELTQLDGVGRWTAEMLLIFSLQRSNVVSWGDFGIRKGMQVLYGCDKLENRDFAERCARYTPYGTVASLYLWEIAKGK